MPRCSLCDHSAVARFRLDQGCIAYPEHREQDLCWHHLRRSRPLGSFELVASYVAPGGPTYRQLLGLEPMPDA